MKFACLAAALLVIALCGGCSGKVKPGAGSGSVGPTLDAQDANERAAAAQEAAKKYGAKP